MVQGSEITNEIPEENIDVCKNVRMASNDNIIEVNQESEITENTVDACSDAGISSKDIKTEEGQESENTEELTEKTIEANFKTHKSYLEKHIDVSDLIGYYELFTQGKIRQFVLKSCNTLISLR